ncbi:MAG TPA: V-type ATP synthase subunit F [Anaerolineaceae bacterium]|jgi:V/A-type H+-transporting ATPase subunit F|nr:V-type ATP synthase subunit F [Anaerolineaceae bacterium]
MNKLVVITIPSMANGYRLAGLEAYGVTDSTALAELLEEFIEKSEPLLLAIDDDLFSHLDQKTVAALRNCKNLALVTIPGRTGKMNKKTSQEYLSKMVRHATGTQFHLKGDENGNDD